MSGQGRQKKKNPPSLGMILIPVKCSRRLLNVNEPFLAILDKPEIKYRVKSKEKHVKIGKRAVRLRHFYWEKSRKKHGSNYGPVTGRHTTAQGYYTPCHRPPSRLIPMT